jgi:hypothetical protein
MKLCEIKKPKHVEPKLPLAKPEDIQAVREAVGFLFAVQKRLEKLDSLYKDTDDYGGIGIYSHSISFRWFGGGGENIPTHETRVIRQIVAEELKKRPHLRRFLSTRVEMPSGEGEINIPWLSGYWSDEWQSAWKAAGMKHVDYDRMVKDMSALGEAVLLYRVNEDLLSQAERANMLLKLLKKSFHAIADASDPPVILVHNLQKFVVISAMKTGGWVMILHKDSKTQKIKAATEEDIIRVLDSLRPVKESQDDVALVWQVAAKEKARRKRVSMAAEVDGQNFKFIQGEIMNIDMTTRKVDVYAYGKSWYIPMKPDDDDRFTLEKDPQSDFYWVKSIEHDEDL